MDVVRRAICDAVAGVCGSDLARIIARDGNHGRWGMDVEDKASKHGHAVFHDWIKGKNFHSLHDILNMHIMEIKHSAPKQTLGKHTIEMLKWLRNKK